MIVYPDNKTLNSEVGNKPKILFIGKVFFVISWLLIIPFIVHLVNLNKLRSLNIKITEAESGIDVQLKNRRDTLIKLIDEVKESIHFEKDMLMNLTKMRVGGNVNQMIKNSNDLDKITKTISLQVENYPNLKSNELIRELMQKTSNIEDNIAAARRIYNSNVSYFNQSINSYPTNIAARQLGLCFQPFFEITDNEREDIKVSFN